MRAWLRERLQQLKAERLLREPAASEARGWLGGGQLESPVATEPPGAKAPLLDACTNDYLGLGARPVSRETLQALGEAQPGAGASRLVHGSWPEHAQVERALAAWTGQEAALLSVSAFSVNLGLVSALCEPDSLVVSDALNHASLVDGCRLARAQVVVTPHLQLEPIEAALRQRSGRAPALVLVESLYSMDGDSPDLPALRALCDRYGAWLVVDEAHALGVFGPEGAGLAAATGASADVLVGGLGKAVGAQGGFAAGCAELRDWLWNRSRPFVYSTAMSPLLCRVVLAQIEATRQADGLRAALAARSSELRSALGARGLPVVPSHGPIVPVLLGSNERALRAVAVLHTRGIVAQAIRPPTVPLGAARLRLTAHADWPEDAAVRIADALEQACGS